jgi:hypothetical protein
MTEGAESTAAETAVSCAWFVAPDGVVHVDVYERSDGYYVARCTECEYEFKPQAKLSTAENEARSHRCEEPRSIVTGAQVVAQTVAACEDEDGMVQLTIVNGQLLIERPSKVCKRDAFLDDPMTEASGMGSEMVDLIDCDCDDCKPEAR